MASNTLPTTHWVKTVLCAKLMKINLLKVSCFDSLFGTFSCPRLSESLGKRVVVYLQLCYLQEKNINLTETSEKGNLRKTI